MSSINLTAQQTKMLLAVGKDIQAASIDWSRVANELGLKSAKSARDSWYPIRAKLFGKETTDNGSGGTPKSSAKKATPRKRKQDEEDGDDEESTPSKPKPSKKGKKTVEQDDDEEVKETFIKPDPADENEDENDGML